jgi:hypothetical protein
MAFTFQDNLSFLYGQGGLTDLPCRFDPFNPLDKERSLNVASRVG